MRTLDSEEYLQTTDATGCAANRSEAFIGVVQFRVHTISQTRRRRGQDTRVWTNLTLYHGKNHSTAFYRFPSRRVVFYERERVLRWSRLTQEPWRNTCRSAGSGRGLVCVGGATHVGGFKGGVCSASVKRFSDQSSQTQTNVSISNEIWSLNLFMMKIQKENTVFQFLLLVISFKPHLNDFTWF